MRKKKNTHEIVIIQRTVKQKQKSVMKITNIYIYIYIYIYTYKNKHEILTNISRKKQKIETKRIWWKLT